MLLFGESRIPLCSSVNSFPLIKEQRGANKGIQNIPAPEHILVLKMIAWLEKDMDDMQALLQHLRIKNRKRAEKVLKKYGDRELLQDYASEVEEALSFSSGRRLECEDVFLYNERDEMPGLGAFFEVHAT